MPDESTYRRKGEKMSLVFRDHPRRVKINSICAVRFESVLPQSGSSPPLRSFVSFLPFQIFRTQHLFIVDGHSHGAVIEFRLLTTVSSFIFYYSQNPPFFLKGSKIALVQFGPVPMGSSERRECNLRWELTDTTRYVTRWLDGRIDGWSSAPGNSYGGN